MKSTLKLLLSGFLLIGCGVKTNGTIETDKKAEYNNALADELKKMAELDQIAAFVPQGKYKDWSAERWDAFKDSVFTNQQKRVKEIFDRHGFVGIDLAGEEGSLHFWLIVQHSDHDPEFQRKVLQKMKREVDRQNASASNYALLVDRVRVNTGRPQLYGTQVTFNTDTGQAYPKDLEDSTHVNERRKSVGLDPLEEYLNLMTEMHFEMNKKQYLDKGLTGPKLYKVGRKE